MDRLLRLCRTKVAERDRLNLGHYASSLLSPFFLRVGERRGKPSAYPIIGFI